MGNNSVPKFIFRLSRFPVYRGIVLGRFYCTMLTRTGILTVRFTTLLHLSLCFKRKNSDVYSGDALFESAPRYCLSLRGVIMVSIGLNTMCRGGASNRPRSIPNSFNLLFISYSVIRLHAFQLSECFVK